MYENNLQSETIVVKNCLLRRNITLTFEHLKMMMGVKIYPDLYELLLLTISMVLRHVKEVTVNNEVD